MAVTGLPIASARADGAARVAVGGRRSTPVGCVDGAARVEVGGRRSTPVGCVDGAARVEVGGLRWR